ncbi:MAG: peptidoglycan-binding protein [Solirubrobacteraceae bacterium]
MRRLLLVLSVLAWPPAAQAHAAVSGNVAALQVALRATGDYAGTVDGVAGAATRAAVRAFQRRNPLTPDGVAGPLTRRALGRRGRPGWGSRTLAADMEGWDVAVLQFKLARRGFPSGNFDGGFGPRLQAALKRFQTWAGLPAVGVAGPATRAALGRRPPDSPLRFYRPVEGPLGDAFGPRGNRFHSGIDFTVGAGVPTRAAGRGCVRSAGGDGGGYGNLVVIEHRLGVTSWYAHLSSVAVRQGQCVAARQLIGRVGSTGNSYGPHAHFELRLRDAVVDPAHAFL